MSGEDFVLTVIARRSRHYAGTRYFFILKALLAMFFFFLVSFLFCLTAYLLPNMNALLDLRNTIFQFSLSKIRTSLDMPLILTTRFFASSLLMCRYLRRGVNDIGRVANDVETEQIVSKVVPGGEKIPIASVVQIRGSIPLFWSQEASVFNPQPEIICKHHMHLQQGSLVFSYLNTPFSVFSGSQ